MKISSPGKDSSQESLQAATRRRRDMWRHGRGGQGVPATILNCTKARALRQAVRCNWTLPPDCELQRSGPDWVLLSLRRVNDDCRGKLMLIWWRSWHLRNDIIFSKGDAFVTASAQFLFSYAKTLASLEGRIPAPDPKGKSPLFDMSAAPLMPATQKLFKWKPPETGWIKLNVDASFFASSGAAAWGAIIRDENGSVLVSAWNLINHCPNAETAEGTACLEGINLARQFCNLLLVVESGCQSLISLIWAYFESPPAFYSSGYPSVSPVVY
ncbi:hypothetical protein BRADI_1g04772v3 [Brachypodium distachyon]|uniref:RNase H type-1 domain-containing protein n=1 Tax=Brachypodium distachyon TaxID=15368 RepID=A0A0Q3RH63_BRADI|nr:hypothetical protein BRADI_1g04772v3 [Brachypodium distachyon]